MRLDFASLSDAVSELFYKSLEMEEKLRRTADDIQPDSVFGYYSATAHAAAWAWYEKETVALLEKHEWMQAEFEAARVKAMEEFYERCNLIAGKQKREGV